MFTGLVETMLTVSEVEVRGPGRRLVLNRQPLSGTIDLGESIALNGCCLTVVASDAEYVAFDAGSETLSRTNLGRLRPGSRVNAERSLRLGDRLGGHLVTGHVDAAGELCERREEGDWSHLRFKVPPQLTRQMASKGSITVDGVSLTLVDVLADAFTVALIPHTLQVTTLGCLQVGDPVNLETDVIAKYVERQLAGQPGGLGFR